MRLGHGPAGAVGVSTNYQQMVKWALSFALSGEVCRSVQAMGDSGENVQTHHKEEAIGRIKIDQLDRKKIRDTLDLCIDPMDDTSHPDGKLLNIVTGQTASPEVNVDNALSLGQTAILEFTNGWPKSFYDSISKLVVTMDVKQKQLFVGKKRVYDQELIYARVIGLLASARDINIDDVLSFELAAYPPSMFDSDGMMKIGKTKSSLKNKLKVTVSERSCPSCNVLIYDVSAMLWPTLAKWKTQCFCGYIQSICLQRPPNNRCHSSV